MRDNIESYYTGVQNKDATWEGIGLTSKAGKYQGEFAKEENADGSLNLTFDWEMLDSNGLPNEFFEDDFKNLIGDILVNILDNQIEEGKLGYDDRGDSIISVN